MIQTIQRTATIYRECVSVFNIDSDDVKEELLVGKVEISKLRKHWCRYYSR